MLEIEPVTVKAETRNSPHIKEHLLQSGFCTVCTKWSTTYVTNVILRP